MFTINTHTMEKCKKLVRKLSPFNKAQHDNKVSASGQQSALPTTAKKKPARNKQNGISGHRRAVPVRRKSKVLKQQPSSYGVAINPKQESTAMLYTTAALVTACDYGSTAATDCTSTIADYGSTALNDCSSAISDCGGIFG